MEFLVVIVEAMSKHDGADDIGRGAVDHVMGVEGFAGSDGLFERFHHHGRFGDNLVFEALFAQSELAKNCQGKLTSADTGLVIGSLNKT